MSGTIINGDFEIDWGVQSSHRALALVDGVPQPRAIENIFTPPHWLTWFVHKPGTWDQPEVRDAWVQNDPARVHGGRKGMLLFTFYRQHDAGFMQQVAVTPGQRLRLTAFAHAWSNHDEPWCTHADDPTWSTGIGRGGVAAIEGAFPLTGKPLDDAKSNFIFAVGIDPTGGTNPLADTVVWGQAWHIYNAYHPVTVEAVAQATTVTVFLRSRTLWSFKHNDAYWDDVGLEVVGDVPVPPTDRGKPRVQYERTYVLYPPGTTLAEKHELLDAYPDNTIGPSADDAGIGDLDKRNVIAYNPGGWPGDLEAFFEQYYAGVNYAEIGDAPVPPTVDFLLSQRDPAWASEKIAGSACTSTIGAMGCWITCCAMAQRYLGIDTQATPSTANRLLGPTGFSGCNTLWSAMKSKLGLEVVKSTRDLEEVNQWMWSEYDDQLVFVRVYLNGEHWVMCYVWNSGNLLVADPYRNVTDWLDKLYPAGPWENGETPPFRLVRKLQATPPPPPPPPPAQPRNLISFQQQHARDYRDEFISRVQPPAWLLIGGFEEAAHLKSLAPNMRVALRHVDNAWGQYVFASDKTKAAEKWVAHYGQTLFDQADNIDYILGLNEWHATNDYDALNATAAWIEALINRMDKLGWPARLVGLNVPVGNPQTNAICDQQGIPRQVPLLIPAVRMLTDADCLVGYHSYWGARKLSNGAYYCTLDDGKDYWYSMRALLDWDPVFTAAGVYPRYAFTEGGPIYVNEAGAMVSSGAGWRYSVTYGGDIDAAIASVLKFNQMGNAWNATHGDRLEWLAMFLHGGFDDWKWFDWKGEPSRRLADKLVAL